MARALRSHFPKDHVFHDVKAIPAGVQFKKHLREKLATSDVILILIDSDWLDVKKGRKRRLDIEDDPVRMEIETAIAHKLELIPVLIEDAKLPRHSDLPESLRPIRKCHTAELTAVNDETDIKRLIDAIETALKRRTAQHKDDAEKEKLEADLRQLEEFRNAEEIWFKTHTIKFRKHLRDYPDGVTAPRIKQRLYEIWWPRLNKQSTIHAIEQFLKTFPDCDAREDALALRRSIKARIKRESARKKKENLAKIKEEKERIFREAEEKKREAKEAEDQKWLRDMRKANGKSGAEQEGVADQAQPQQAPGEESNKNDDSLPEAQPSRLSEVLGLIKIKL